MEYLEESVLLSNNEYLTNSSKAIIAYLTFFGTKYINQELSESGCKNLFNTPFVKFCTLYAIFYQATNNVRMALSFAILASLFHFYMKKMEIRKDCKKP